MNVYLLPVGNISRYLPSIVEQFERVCEAHPDKYDVDYWLSQIYNGTYSLWGLFDGADLKGILLTQFRMYPKRKVLFFSSGATDPHVFEKFKPAVFDTMYRFAKDHQCNGVEFEGRPGWQKVIKDFGFVVDNVTYSLTFGESNE